VEAGRGMTEGALIVGIGTDYARTSGLFTADDTNSQFHQRLWLTWSPFEFLALSVSEATSANTNSAFDPGTVQTSGDPTFGFKVARGFSQEIGAALGVTAFVPTSAGGHGLNASALVLRGYAAVSVEAAPWLDLSLNGGYVLDRTSKVFKRDLLPVQRFAAGINSVDQVTSGFAAETQWPVGEGMLFGSFVEVSAAFGFGTTFKRNPILASGGFKLHPFGADAISLTVGGDYAIQGLPNPNGGKLAGVSPWTVFGLLSTNLVGRPGSEAVADAGPKTCTEDSVCREGQSCVDGICAVVREVVKTEKVVEETPTFQLQGTVVDATKKEPIGTAIVTIGGFESSPLAVDYKTGAYASWPLPAGDGLLKVTVVAQGYRPAEQTMPRGAAGEKKVLDIVLQSTGEAAVGKIRGILKDAKSGKPVRAQILIPALGQKIRADNEGGFEADVKEGRYQVLISARGYVTQKKEIEIRAGDVVILNVDLLGRRR